MGLLYIWFFAKMEGGWVEGYPPDTNLGKEGY